MSTITREWLKLKIADMEARRDDPWLGLDEDDSNTLAALRRALASLEAEAVAWISERNLKNLGKSYSVYVKHEPVMVRPIPLYTAPPASVVPDEIRNRLKAEGLAELLKDARDNAPLTAAQWETLANNWFQTFAGLSGKDETCRAAMLQGAKPVTTANKLPEGYVLVPVELTGAMTNAMTDAILDDLHNVDVWRSVLAAAPQQEVK